MYQAIGKNSEKNLLHDNRGDEGGEETEDRKAT